MDSDQLQIPDESESSISDNSKTRRTIEFDTEVWEKLKERYPTVSPWYICNGLLREFLNLQDKGIDDFIKLGASAFNDMEKEQG